MTGKLYLEIASWFLMIGWGYIIILMITQAIYHMYKFVVEKESLDSPVLFVIKKIPGGRWVDFDSEIWMYLWLSLVIWIGLAFLWLATSVAIIIYITLLVLRYFNRKKRKRLEQAKRLRDKLENRL